MVGVKSYFPENKPDFQEFRKCFHRKFTFDYPEEEQDEPGIFAVEGYNVVKLLEKNSQKQSSEIIVEIVNVIGKGYHSVYWTEGSGFSETIEDETNGFLATNYTNFMDNVGQVLWPVQPWYASRRHQNLAESSENVMKVRVPAQSMFKQFVLVENDEKNQTVFDGFVVKVFHETMSQMNQKYKLYPFNGSYDKLIETFVSEEFNAVAGDVTIVSRRHDFADFTQPYTESGLEMIVPVRSRLSNKAWLFLKPFSLAMWWLIAAITIYNGFIIWLIERNDNEHLRGSIID